MLINMKDKAGVLPIMAAAKGGHKSMKVFIRLACYTLNFVAAFRTHRKPV